MHILITQNYKYVIGHFLIIMSETIDPVEAACSEASAIGHRSGHVRAQHIKW